MEQDDHTSTVTTPEGSLQGEVESTPERPPRRALARRGLPRTTQGLAQARRGPRRTPEPGAESAAPAAGVDDASAHDDPFAVHLDDGQAWPREPDGPDHQAIHDAAEHGLTAPAGELPFRGQLEQSFGRDLSGVRAHQGPAADQASAAMGANAYATGADVVLPSSPELGLVAHEVAHVFQQADGVQLHGGVGADGDPYERQADDVAAAVIRGESVAHHFGGAAAPRSTGVQRAAVQRDQGKPAPGKAPGKADGPAGPPGLTIEEERRRQAMIAALPNITERWRRLGPAAYLFNPDNLKPDDGALRPFTDGAYDLILSEESEAELTSVAAVLRGPGREQFLDALQAARNRVAADRPRFDKLTAAIEDLKRSGDLRYNATNLLAARALLSSSGKLALTRRRELAVQPLDAYLQGECKAHGVLAKKADLIAKGMIEPFLDPLAEAGAIERLDTCVQLRGALLAGPPPDTSADAPVEPKVALDEAARLKTAIIKELGSITPGNPVPVTTILALDNALVGVSPRAKELVWIDAQVMGLIARVLDPNAAKKLLGKLDTVEALYQDCKPTVELQLQLEKTRMVGRAVTDKSLRSDNAAFPKLKEWLLARPGDTNAGLRGRVLAHTKLKDDIIDRLPAEQSRLVYRMVVRGTAVATDEDTIHEAAEAGDGAKVAKALQGLAATNPGRLAELERDLIFRKSIEKMTQPVKCDGVEVVPYHLALTMWGRKPSDAIDPLVAAVTETAVLAPGQEDKPLTAIERMQLTTELFAPALADVAGCVKGTNFYGQNVSGHGLLMSTTHLDRAQAVLDRLRVFERKAADEPYLGYLRRERLVAGREFDKRFHEIHGIALRTWIYENGGPNIRSGAARILGTEQGATVGEFNGQVVGLDQAQQGHISIQQALRETKATSIDFGGIKEDWTLSEFASVESRDVARGINDSDEAKVLLHWHRLRRAFSSKHEELKRLTGVSIAPLDILRNAHLEHSGHLEARIDEKFSGEPRDRIRKDLGLDVVPDGTPPPSPEEKAQQMYATPASALWAAHRALGPDSDISTFAAAYALRAIALAMPRLDGKPGQPTDGDREERPPPSFGAYYRQQYGISPRRHAVAVVRALPKSDRLSSPEVLASAFGLTAEEVTGPIKAPSETLAIDEHNQHLVRGAFTVEEARDRARQIWSTLHTSGRMEIINGRLYGDCNDEEQRLIRIAFRELSGGIDLSFYIRQAIESQKAVAGSWQYKAAQLSPLAGAVKNQDQVSRVGAEGADDGNPFHTVVNVHGTETELDAALAVAMGGEIDLNTRLRTAAKNDNSDQVFRILEEASAEQRRKVLKDGALVNQLQRLGQWQWERCFKVLTGQADLADRMYSRSHGDGTWTESSVFGGGTHEKGMKEDLNEYVKRLRKKCDADVRAEVDADPRKRGLPPNIIEREINRRVMDGAAALLGHKDVTAIMASELDGDEYAEMRAILAGAGVGTEREWAVAGGGGKAAVMAEIKGMKPERRAARLRDPEYLRLLSERLKDEDDYRDAINALSATGDADTQDGGGALARLDQHSRTDAQAEGSERDGRKALRALSELTPTELRKLQHDPQLQVQVMAALNSEERAIARQLLEAPPDPTAAEGKEVAPKDAANAKADLLVRQSIGRLQVALRGSWRDVLVQAAAVYKLNLLEGFSKHGGGGGNGEQDLDDKSPLSAADLKAKRGSIWTAISATVTGFAEIHRNDPTRKTKDSVTPEKMVQIVHGAVMGVDDPSPALIAENIYTSEEKGAGDPHAQAVIKQFHIDATVDEQGVKDTLRAASDDHVIQHWVNVKERGAEGGPTMKQVYDEFAAADAKAVPIAQARRDAALAPPPKPVAPAAPGNDGKVKTAVPQGPMATQANAVDHKEGDAVIRDARTKQRKFLEFAIMVSQELERMLLPFLGDDRTASQDLEGVKTAGRSNKRYNALAEIILERVPELPPTGIGRAIGIQDQHAWLLHSTMRKVAAETYLRDEQYLRYRGEQTSNGGVAQDEKEAYDQEYTLLKRTTAKITTDGQITGEEGEAHERRLEATDRASEEYQTAKQQAAAWAALIVGVLVTLVATVLTGGVATGAVAMFAISAATAALSATAKALVMKEYLGDEFDSKDQSEMIAKEVITGIVAAGTTFYAQKLLSAVGSATTLAKQANAMRQVLRTPPKLWQSIAHEAIEEAVSEGMTSVVEAGLAATDPIHWMHGYEEGAREAKAAALARISQAPRDMLRGAVSSIVTAGANKMLRRKPKREDHALVNKMSVPADKKQRAIDLAANARQVFGDPGDKVLEALVQWGLEQAESDGPINWANAPADLLKGVIEEFGEAGTEMHTSTAHKGNRQRRMEDDLKRADQTLPKAQRDAFRQMQEQAHDTEAYVSLDQFVRARQQVATAGLQATLAKHKFELTEAQQHAFLAWVQTAETADQLSAFASTDPRTLPQVMAAGTAAAPKPPRTHHAGAHHAVTDDAPPPPAPPPPTTVRASDQPTVRIAPAPSTPQEAPRSERRTEPMPTVADPSTAQGAADATPDPTPASTRPTLVIETPATPRDERREPPPSERTTQVVTAVDPTAPATPSRDLTGDLPDLHQLQHLSRDVIGAHQQGAIQSALAQLSEPDYQQFRTLHAAMPSATGRGFLYKALAAGNNLASVQWLAWQIQGKDDAWMLDNLTLGDPRGVGAGLAQQWSMSCNAATTMVLRGNYDPVFALGLRQANPNISNFDQHNPMAYNADLAAREKAMLESAYQGNNAEAQGYGGIAAPRAAGESRGRWADDLMNAQADATGMQFASHRGVTAANALNILDGALARDMHVPVVIGRAPNNFAHYVMATGLRQGPTGPEYRFFNVASGMSKWVTRQQIQSGTMDLDGGVMITAVEEPTAIGRAGAPAATAGRPAGGPSTLTRADAPHLTNVAMAAVTQKMPAAVATQVLSVQLADEGAAADAPPPAPQPHAPPTTGAQVPTAAPSMPTMRLQVPAPVTQAVAELVHPAARTAVEVLASTAKPGGQVEAARQEFERMWRDGVIDVAAFRARYDLEYEDAVAKIQRSMQSPELAAVLKDVPEEQLVAILLYTSTHYVEWNRTLRAADKTSLPEVGDGLALADRGLSKLPIHQGWVMRGADQVPAEVLARYVPGEVITEDAFTSTSRSDGGQYKGNVQFKIKSRTGRDVAGLSRYDNEQEILFRPGTRFLVTDKERDGDTIIITMEEVEGPPGGAPGGPGGPGGARSDQTTTTDQDRDRDPDGEREASTDRDAEVERPPTVSNADLKSALARLAKLEHARYPRQNKIHKQRAAVRALLERAHIRDPQRRADLDALLQDDPRLQEALQRALAELEQHAAIDEQVDRDRDRRARERESLGVQGEQGRHGGVEVHSHFLGVVETEVFRDAYGSWHQMLDAIVAIQRREDAKAKTDGEASRKLSHSLYKTGTIRQRGSAGDALRIATEALADIKQQELALRAKHSGADLDAKLAEMRERIAEQACKLCLAASDDTDFNSAYEIRDELLKESFAGIVPATPARDGETDAERQEREAKDEAERGRRVDPAYYELAKETVRRLIDDGILLTEQSNSIGKLQRRFKPGVLERAIEAVIEEIAQVDPKRADELRKNFRVTFLSMGLSLHYGRPERKPEVISPVDDKVAKARNQTTWLEELVNQFGYGQAVATLEAELKMLRDPDHVRAPNTHGNAENARIRELEGYLAELSAKAEKFQAMKNTEVVMRDDVVGIDTAGQELYEFTAGGKERFKVMYLALVNAAHAKNEVLVFRPHVGEGAINPKRGESWNAFKNRWEDAEGRPIHYGRAEANLQAMIEVLQELQAQQLLDPKAVTIRFGHATHMNPAQAAALAELRDATGVSVIAEVNLGSNIATNVVDQKDSPRRGKADEDFSDHSLLTLIYNQVQTILSTDGHAVEKTTMGEEYGRAYDLIEKFLAGKMTVRVTEEQANGRGVKIDHDVHQLAVGDLNQDELKRFLNAYAQLHQWAAQYRDTDQRGGTPIDPGAGSKAKRAETKDLAATETGFTSPAIEKARQARLEREGRLDDRAELAGQQDADVAALNTALDSKDEHGGMTDEAKRRRERIVAELQRQNPDLALQDQLAGGAQTVLTLNVSGGGDLGVKTMNDKYVGMDINTDIIRARNELMRTVLANHGFTVVEQGYKATTFVSMLPDGPDLQARLAAALKEIDEGTKTIMIAGLERGAAHWASKDPARSTLNQQKADELRGKADFALNATVGATSVDRESDALTAKMNASRAALMARVEPGAEPGRDARSGSYDEGKFTAMLERAVTTARTHVGQTVTMSGVAVAAFVDEGGQILPNLDVLRAFRKNKLDPDTHTPDIERPLLRAFKQYIDAVNTFDYYKHTLGREHDEGGAVDRRQAEVRAMIDRLRDGGAVDLAELDRMLHSNAAGVEVAQQDTASEAQWHNLTRQHSDRIVLNLDVKDLGLNVMAAQARTMNAVVEGHLRGQALEDAARSTDDEVINGKRRALAKIRDRYQAVLARAIASEADPILRAQLEAERDVPLLMGGDEFTLSVHPALRRYLPALVADLSEAANARVAVTDAKSPKPDSQRANQKAHREAMQAGESGHDKLKKSVEAAYQALALRVGTLPKRKQRRGEDLLAAAGLTSLYAEIVAGEGGPAVILREQGSGAEVTEAALEERIRNAQDRLQALMNEP